MADVSRLTQRVQELTQRGGEQHEIAAILGITPLQVEEVWLGVDLPEPTSEGGPPADVHGDVIVPTLSASITIPTGPFVLMVPKLGIGSLGTDPDESENTRLAGAIGVGPFKFEPETAAFGVNIGRHKDITSFVADVRIANADFSSFMHLHADVFDPPTKAEEEERAEFNDLEVAEHIGTDLSYIQEEGSSPTIFCGPGGIYWVTLRLSIPLPV